MQFEWDEQNTGHIARHQVAPEEVEQAYANHPLTLSSQIRSGETRILCAGLTASGRALQFVYTLRKGRIRVITAHTAKRKVRKQV